MRRRCVNSATLALQRAVERPFPRDSLSMGDYGGGGYGGGGGGGYGGGGGGGGGGNVRYASKSACNRCGTPKPAGAGGDRGGYGGGCVVASACCSPQSTLGSPRATPSSQWLRRRRWRWGWQRAARRLGVPPVPQQRA